MWARIKRFVQSSIGFSGREANAFIILLPTLFLIVFSQPIYRLMVEDDSPIAIEETVFIDSLIASAKSVPPPKDNTVLSFEFDPNKISQEQFVSLGIPERIAARIIQYRSKGGVFRIKSDFAKIYGLEPALYSRLEPLITLPNEIEPKSFKREPEKIINTQFDLNLADTTDFKSINGIGTVLSKRLIKYRDALGGFVDKKQLFEVYGLDSTVVNSMDKFFVSTSFTPNTIHINSATESELSRHPYLSSKESKSIITYRMQYGPFVAIDDLRQIKMLREQTLNKVAPYLSFE